MTKLKPFSRPILSVIVISYNTAKMTLQTINSVLADFDRSVSLRDQAQLVVVDNDSQDDSVKQLKKIKDSRLNLIKNKKNLGFSQANNLAIKKYPADFYLLLNSDTIVHSGALEKLVQTMAQHPVQETTASLESEQGKLDKLGILAATLLNSDGTIQPQGGHLPTLTNLFFQMSLLDDLPLLGQLLPSPQQTGQRFSWLKRRQYQKRKPFQQGWVGGTAMLIRHSLTEEIGLLDPNIFMYGEDIEYCLRARHHHWDIAIDPQAQVTHFGSGSSSSFNALKGELENYVYIWSKHKPDWQLPLLKSVLWFGAVLRSFLFGTILKDNQKAKAYRQAANLIKG
ncbi:MAG: glycosyltransferase [Candidatus Pacebacteria bacterium]|nr:glycosyltransferase [Candidatus Paceibacterota bacterium]